MSGEIDRGEWECSPLGVEIKSHREKDNDMKTDKRTTISMSREEWVKIGEKKGWNMRGAGEEYSPNMDGGVIGGDAGKPKCAGCGTPADRIVDKSSQEWSCQKCKMVNRLKGAESLTFPVRLDESKDKSPAEKKGATAAPARTAADDEKVLPLIKMTRTRVEEYHVCPHCQQEIGEKESFFSQISRKAEANGRVVFQHRRCGGHYDMGPVVPLESFLKRL